MTRARIRVNGSTVSIYLRTQFKGWQCNWQGSWCWHGKINNIKILVAYFTGIKCIALPSSHPSNIPLKEKDNEWSESKEVPVVGCLPGPISAFLSCALSNWVFLNGVKKEFPAKAHSTRSQLWSISSTNSRAVVHRHQVHTTSFKSSKFLAKAQRMQLQL